jgi:hypothetical protein
VTVQLKPIGVVAGAAFTIRTVARRIERGTITATGALIEPSAAALLRSIADELDGVQRQLEDEHGGFS